MWPRTYWQAELARLWKRRTVVWLPGVRRAGKTTLVVPPETAHPPTERIKFA